MKLRNKETGEIVEINKIGLVWNKYGMPTEIGQYDSLAELNEEWEDVPQEPLIKDEKIRNAVRAWAEVTVEEDDLVVAKNMEYHDYCIYTDNLSNTALIDFGIDLQIQEGSYTITELCGEEE